MAAGLSAAKAWVAADGSAVGLGALLEQVPPPCRDAQSTDSSPPQPSAPFPRGCKRSASYLSLPYSSPLCDLGLVSIPPLLPEQKLRQSSAKQRGRYLASPHWKSTARDLDMYAVPVRRARQAHLRRSPPDARRCDGPRRGHRARGVLTYRPAQPPGRQAGWLVDRKARKVWQKASWRSSWEAVREALSGVFAGDGLGDCPSLSWISRRRVSRGPAVLRVSGRPPPSDAWRPRLPASALAYRGRRSRRNPPPRLLPSGLGWPRLWG